jgi:hypothetical protein
MKPERFALAVILLVAGFLRLHGLGDRGLWIDEDLTFLSVRGVLEEGVPRHPSGGIYSRAPVHTYLAAASAAVFGADEFGLRLPSVLSSLAGLWTSFVLARDIGGRAVGFVTLLVLALSGWDVLYARMARMYAPTVFLFTLSVWLIYRRAIREDIWAGRWAILVGGVATTMHPLAASLALVFLGADVLAGRDRVRNRWAWTGFFVLATVLVVHRAGSSMLWSLGGPSAVPPAMANTDLRIPGVGGLTIERARVLLIETLPSTAWSAVAILIVFLSLTFGVLLLRRKTGATGIEVTGAAAWAAAVTVNMPTVAAVFGSLWVRVTARDGREAARRLLGVGAATASVLLAIMAAATWVGADVFSNRGLATSFGVPEPWWILLAKAFPAAFGIVIAGSILLFLDSFDSTANIDSLFVTATFWTPLILMGFVESPYVQLRYLVHLNPLFILLLVLSLRRLVSMLPGPSRVLHRPLGILVLGGVALLSSGQSTPNELLGVVRLDYGSNRIGVRNPDAVSHFYYDGKTPAEFVAKSASPGDLLVARDGPLTFAYTGRVDYVFRASNFDGAATSGDGRLVDQYLGVPVLDSVAALQALLLSGHSGSVWVIVAVPEGDRPIVNLPTGAREWLRAREDRVVYTGLDGITKVYRFGPGATSSSNTPSTLPANSLLR